MKTKLYVLFALLFIGFANIKAQEISLANVEGAVAGEEVLVPVNFTNMSDIGSISLSFTFDDAVVNFIEVTNIIPELSSTLIYNLIPDPPAVAIIWFDLTGVGVDVPDGIAFDVKFSYIQGETDLVFTDACQVSNSQSQVIEVNFIDGSISPESGSSTSAWNGTGNWSNEANWSNGVPGAESIATVESGELNIFSGATCKSLTINDGADVYIHPNFFLIVTETVSVEGNLSILSDETGTGSFIPYGAVDVTGNLYVNRYLSGNGNTSHFVSSPVEMATADIFTGQTINSFKETMQDWSALAGTDQLMPGFGYEVTNCNNNTIMFEGNVYLTNFSQSLSFTENAGSLPNGLNLLGNPYTTAINWEQGDWIKENIDGAIYTWKNGNYVSWNGSVGAFKNGVIPAMQGFFVVAQTTGASVTIPNNARVQNNQPYYKNENSETDLLALQFYGTGDFEDWTYLRFNNEMTHAYDPMVDAYKLPGSASAPQLYSFSNDGVQLSINEFPKPLEEQDTAFAIGYQVGAEGTYSIVREEYSIYGLPIFLHDKTLNQFVDLKVDSVYEFASQAGAFNNRFEILFRDPLSINESTANQLKIFSSGRSVLIHSETAIKNPLVQVFNLQGRLVYEKQLKGDGFKYAMDVSNISGMFIVRVTNPDIVKSQKVFLR